jgi:hypothetical protein
LKVLSGLGGLESLGLFGWVRGGEFVPVPRTDVRVRRRGGGLILGKDKKMPGGWEWDEELDEESRGEGQEEGETPFLNEITGYDDQSSPIDFRWVDEFDRDYLAFEDEDGESIDGMVYGSGTFVNFVRWLLYAERSPKRRKRRDSAVKVRRRLGEEEVNWLKGKGRCEGLINVAI